jgi:hypothetical protein
MPESEMIDVVTIVDGTIHDCMAANIPPYPAVIAETLARVFCQRQSTTEHALCFAQLLVLTRERIEFLIAATQAPN